MGTQVSAVNRRKSDPVLGTLGRAVGYVWGPAGSAVGGQIGDTADAVVNADDQAGAITGIIGEKVGAQLGSTATDKMGGGKDMGGAIGGSLGGMLGGEQSNSPTQAGPVERRKENLNNWNTMNAGQQALENNPQLKSQFGPILSDAMQKAKTLGRYSA